MKLTTEQCLEGAKKHGEEIMVSDGDWESGKFEYPVYSFNQDELTAYTNDMIEQATQKYQAQVAALIQLAETQMSVEQRRARLAELTEERKK